MIVVVAILRTKGHPVQVTPTKVACFNETVRQGGPGRVVAGHAESVVCGAVPHTEVGVEGGVGLAIVVRQHNLQLPPPGRRQLSHLGQAQPELFINVAEASLILGP